jgi:hypothetical protein
MACAALFVSAACSNTNNGGTDGGASEAAPPIEGGTGDAGDGGSSNPLGFSPSNFDPGQIDWTGLGDVDCTNTGGITSEQTPLLSCGGDQTKTKFTVVTQPNNIKVGIWVARSWRIEPNVVVSVDTIHGGSFPLILVATDTIDILGGLSATASGSHASAGGYAGDPNNNAGGGPGAGAITAQMNYPAAGGGSYCGVGGNGVFLDSMSVSATAAGGKTYGTPQNVPLVGGSSAGGGFLFAGAGGGAIQLVAGKSISIEAGGYVNVGGGGGGAGGGGGSGGALLLESPTVTVAGALAANGGGGASCGTGPDGTDGLNSNMPAAGGMTTSGCVGGNGSAAATMNGANAQATMMSTEGGGGGGAGRIRINTKSGSATLTGGVVSPDPSTSCTTQGKLN